MADAALLSKIGDLSDLELAALLCLSADEHCIIDTDPTSLDDLIQEIRLIASNIFGLTHAIVDCDEATTLESFAASILAPSLSDDPSDTYQQPQTSLSSPSFLPRSRSPSLPFIGLSGPTQRISDTYINNDHRSIANIIIAKNLDEAPKQVQIQALELLRTRRIFTHTAVHNAPRQFLLMALVAGGEGPRLTRHLNDHMFISHFHDPEDGFPNLQELEGDEDGDSISSVVRRKVVNEPIYAAPNPLISESDIQRLQTLSTSTTTTPELLRYTHNLISHLRLHRSVTGGISSAASAHMHKLLRYLAPLHGLSFSTPAMCALAARKVYAHRIRIVDAEGVMVRTEGAKAERSFQWGSELEAVQKMLSEIGGPEGVIEDVLVEVEVPL